MQVGGRCSEVGKQNRRLAEGEQWSVVSLWGFGEGGQHSASVCCPGGRRHSRWLYHWAHLRACLTRFALRRGEQRRRLGGHVAPARNSNARTYPVARHHGLPSTANRTPQPTIAMTQPATMTPTTPAVLPSPLQALILDDALQGPSNPSNSTDPPQNRHLPALRTLALQIQHNLQYQHSWTGLRLHTHSPLTNELLPRPLLSGLPAQRLYVHPDEQIELLKRADRERKTRREAGDDSNALDVKAEPEREWILPTRLSEKWTLRRLSAVFNAISMVPPEAETASTEDHPPANPWRTTKRVVLATADSDSTVVYYIVHDGVVKPRQN